jgi:hypothetical protein
VVILELIHALKSQLLGGMCLLDKKPTQTQSGAVVNHDNYLNRRTQCQRWFIQISALSTFDGRIEAYHGGNG